MLLLKKIIEFRAIIFNLLIIFIVALTGVFLYDNLSSVSTKLIESSKIKMPASFVVKQLILELRTAENNVQSYYLTNDEEYIYEYNRTIPVLKKQITLLNSLSLLEPNYKSTIDSVIFLSKKYYTLIRSQSYSNDPAYVTNELDFITDKINESYKTTEKDNAAKQPIIEAKKDSIIKKSGFFKKLFGKKTKKQQDTIIPYLNKAIAVKAKNDSAKNKLNESVKIVKKKQIKRIKDYKEQEHDYKQSTFFVLKKINYLADQLTKKELLFNKKSNYIISKEVNELKQYSIIFSVIITFLLLSLFYLILVYFKKKNEVEVSLINSKNHSDELVKTKEMFLANMSHEIRTPLNAIYGFTEQISLTNLNPEQRKQLSIVKNSASYLVKLVNNILAYSKLQSGKEKLELTIFDIRKELNEIEELFKIQTDKKNIQLIVEIDALTTSIQTDLYKIKQILFNIVGNAIKFTEKGFVKIHLQALLVGNQNRFTFEITDTGNGISAEQLPKLFKEYEQGDERIQNKHGGTGLGLVITKQIIEHLGGSILITSKEGIGTTVSFNVPFTIPNADELLESTEISVKTNFNIVGKHFLIVDDEELNRLLIKAILKKQKAICTEAQNGQEAIDLVKTKTFDVIIMDVQMPIKNGIETTQEIRQFNEQIPIIGATAVASSEKIARCIHAGMDSVVLKPFTEQDLLLKLESLYTNKENDQSNNYQEQTINADNIINIAAINDYVLEDEVFKKEMIQLFHKSINDSLITIETNFQTKDYLAISDIAHKIIPSCMHFEANQLIATLKYFEQYKNSPVLNEEDYCNKIALLREQITTINCKLEPFI